MSDDVSGFVFCRELTWLRTVDGGAMAGAIYAPQYEG
jgi:hypothetical protein